MRTVSAADSVSLAIQRTRDLLFRPFTWATYLKLGLVAILTEGFSSNLRSSGNHAHPSTSGQGPDFGALHEIPHQWIAYIVAGVFALALLMILALWIAYLVTRLRFAFFHCLVTSTTEIRPGWHLYRDRAARFFWLNIVVGLCFLLVIGLIAIPFVSGFVKLAHDTPPGGHPDWGLLLSLVLPLIPIILLVALAAVLLDVILRDWILPHYALEDASAGEAWSDVWEAITREKREFFVYLLLRLILPMIAMIAIFMVLMIPGLMLAGALAGIEYGIHSAFADAAGAARFVAIALEAFFGVVEAGFALLASICLGGPVGTAVREYALVFYGGRYPALGNLLYPPAAAVQGEPEA